jgi:hypothetical protein
MIYIILLIFFAILYMTRTKNNKKRTSAKKRKSSDNRNSLPRYMMDVGNQLHPTYDQNRILDARMDTIKARIQNDNQIDFRNMTNENTHIDSTLEKINDYYLTKEAADGSRIKDIYDNLVHDGRPKVGLPYQDQPVYVYN